MVNCISIYIYTQTSKGILQNLSNLENSTHPASLTQNGKIRKSKRSNLLSRLFSDDMMKHYIIMLLSKGCKDIIQYAKEINCLPFLTAHLNNCQVLNIVWDVYRSDSFKKDTTFKGKRYSEKCI